MSLFKGSLRICTVVPLAAALVVMSITFLHTSTLQNSNDDNMSLIAQLKAQNEILKEKIVRLEAIPLSSKLGSTTNSTPSNPEKLSPLGFSGRMIRDRHIPTIHNDNHHGLYPNVPIGNPLPPLPGPEERVYNKWTPATLVKKINENTFPDENNIPRYNGQCWNNECFCEPFFTGDRCDQALERKKVAVILVNYNMPERVNHTIDAIKRHVKWPLEIIVVDNGSDIKGESPHTAVRYTKNVQTTNGWLAGLYYAQALAAVSKEPWLGYWIWITSTEYLEDQGDILTPMIELMLTDDNIAGVHPSLTKDSTTSFANHKKTEGKGARPIWVIDFMAAFYRAEFIEWILPSWDQHLTYAWGTDLETGLWARELGMVLMIDEEVTVKKTTNVAYKMGRMNMSSKERKKNAGGQMNYRMLLKYGPGWGARMMTKRGKKVSIMKLQPKFGDSYSNKFCDVVTPELCTWVKQINSEYAEQKDQ